MTIIIEYKGRKKIMKRKAKTSAWVIKAEAQISDTLVQTHMESWGNLWMLIELNKDEEGS